MRRVVVIVVAVVASLIVGFGIGQSWLALDGGEDGVEPNELISVGTSLTPTTHAFGDPVQARAEINVDTREIDLQSLSLQPEFGPYEALDPPKVAREQFGDLGRVTYEYRLVCLKEGCDTAGARGVSDFPTGRLRYRFKDRPGNAFQVFDWPLLEVASRVADADVVGIRWRSDASTLVPASYRVGALGVALALLVAAIGCASAALLIARRLWWPAREDTGPGDAAVFRSPLEQAFDAALRAADGSDDPDRRRALERVARELGSAGRTALADEARSLAWSSAPSTSEQVATLAARVRVQEPPGGDA